MTQVAMATTALQDVRGLRRELLPWIAYHLHLGIAHFYVSTRGGAARLGHHDRGLGISI